MSDQDSTEKKGDALNRRQFVTGAALSAASLLALAAREARADAPPPRPPRPPAKQGKWIDLEGHLAVLAQLTAETKNPDNTHCVLLQHVLPTVTEYVELVNTVYPVDLVIAIVYSADKATVDDLRKRGYQVLVPKSIDEMLNETWKVVAEHLGKVKYPLMIQEVGGYFAEWTAELARFPNFKGCVEDTKNGMWRYQAAAKKKPLAAPVLSMADTPLKRVEDSLIGDACIYSLEKAMRNQMSLILDGLRCGVVGWGNIGKSAAAAFKGRNAVVSLYDIDPVVNMLAVGRGYNPVPLAQLLRESDIVMGCSGRRSIRVADLPDFKDGLVLCSASSKSIEIDLVGLAKLCDIQDLTPKGEGFCPVEKYTVRATGKCFYVLDHGTPIDFLDKPLSGAILDCTYSELFVCMREVAAGKRANGLVELPIDFQTAVANRWLKAHTESFAEPDAPKDKVFAYPGSLEWE